MPFREGQTDTTPLNPSRASKPIDTRIPRHCFKLSAAAGRTAPNSKKTRRNGGFRASVTCVRRKRISRAAPGKKTIPLQLDDSALYAKDYGMRSVICTKLREDALYVAFNGLLRNR